MKIFIIFPLTFCVVNAHNRTFTYRRHQNDTKAISEVAEEIFTRRKIDFEIIELGKGSKTLQTDEIIKIVLENGKKSKKIYQLEDLREWEGTAALVVADDSIKFNKIRESIRNGSKLVIYTTQSIELQPNSTFDASPFNNLDFVYFIVRSRNKIVLISFERWTEKACNEIQIVTHNIFDGTKWQKPLTIPEKFTNFHGCTLKTFAHIFLLPIYEMMDDAGYASLHSGISRAFEIRNKNEAKVTKIFAEIGNYTENRGKRTDRDLQVYQEIFGTVKPKNSQEVCSPCIYDTTLKFIYTPPEPYTNYEKMILPFDEDTWLFLIAVFCSCFVGILIINLLPQGIRNLVYGIGINMPSFNVLSIIFGIGQTKLPQNNFARIILMTFIWFCFIMRTAYQGVFFEMFTKEMLRVPPKTFADLKARNYTLYTANSKNLSYNFAFNLIDAASRPNMENVDFQEGFNKIFLHLNEPSLKASMPMTDLDGLWISEAFLFPNILEEDLTFEPIQICVETKSFFAYLHVKVSNNLVTNGILQHHLKYFKSEAKPMLKPPNEPKVFAMEDLNFGFIVWLVACAITLPVFLCELLHHFWIGHLIQHLIYRVKRKLRGLIGVILIAKFLRQKRFL